jgi:argininosuccinate lyase
VDVRGRRLRKRSDEVTAFTSSMAFDGQIASQTIRTNMAHMISLIEGKEVTPDVGRKCLLFLSEAPTVGKKNEHAEDFHQFLEQKAVDALGVEVAGYLNLGKSRNDQVATAIRMKLREEILTLVNAVRELQSALLNVARTFGRTVIPGYTHLQRAQPVTVAHYCFAHFDALQRDVERLLQLYPRVNVSPMGAAALGGTPVRLQRRLVAELLGFDGVVANAMDAVSSRDVAVEALSVASILMLDVSRLSEELVLWSSKEFGFIELSDEYAAGSSIMPQKKNPVVAELARAKSGSVLGALTAVTAIMKSLPYSYNLDLQETTPHLWRGLSDASSSVALLSGMVSTLKFKPRAIGLSIRGDYSTATALADYLARQKGISFREAHAIVGELVAMSNEEGTPFEKVVAQRIGRVSSRLARRLTISEKEAAKILEPEGFLAAIVTEGGSNPAKIPEGVEMRARQLGGSGGKVARIATSMKDSERKMLRRVEVITKEVKD